MRRNGKTQRRYCKSCKEETLHDPYINSTDSNGLERAIANIATFFFYELVRNASHDRYLICQKCDERIKIG